MTYKHKINKKMKTKKLKQLEKQRNITGVCNNRKKENAKDYGMMNPKINNRRLGSIPAHI